jgi:hypothetical protein
MKKLFCLVLLTFISISCSNSDEEETPIDTIDPTKLAKVIFYPGASNETHWNFNKNGLLKEITLKNGTILENFIYDVNKNLLNYTILYINYIENKPRAINNFTYDSNNHITSYNGQDVTFNQLLNSYTVHAKNAYGLVNTEIKLNDDLLIVDEKENYMEEVAYSVQGFRSSYENHNMKSFGSNSRELEGNYKYDNKVNPFKQALLPICKAMGITSFENAYGKWAIGEYNSLNNVIFNDFDYFNKSGYIYEYNSNNLPITRTSKIYNAGVLEQSILNVRYYYQGDVIP